jgi:NAD(P)-dependent dehydrogenase (short-subunit alcohol dehydrogenase family)
MEAIKLDTTKKTVVITGANSGVGFQATKQLATTNNWNVIMACRNREKAEAAKSTIRVGNENVYILDMDLADLKSVKTFSSLLANTPIDVLVCNAGIQESTTGLGKTYLSSFETLLLYCLLFTKWTSYNGIITIFVCIIVQIRLSFKMLN